MKLCNYIKSKRLLRFSVIPVLICISCSLIYGQTIERKALLVIDVQENLVNPHSKMHIDTSGINMFFSNLNTTITQFHDNKGLVVYIVNEWTNPIKNWATGNVCKKGGPGVGLDKKLKVVNNNIYSKSKPNSLSNAALLKQLRAEGITHVYVAGLFAEGCVKSTVKGLLREQFNVVVVEDALGSKNEKNKAKVIRYLQQKNVKTLKVAGNTAM